MGSIISAIDNRFEWSTYHSFEDNKTQIRFSPWDKEIKVSKINQKTKETYEEKQMLPAFGLTVIRNGNQTFRIALEPGEAQCLKEVCRFLLSMKNKKTWELNQKLRSSQNNSF